MSYKYHINPETGKPGKCTATVKGCKYAINGELPEHYNSIEKAHDAYEKSQTKNIFPSNNKNSNAEIGSKINAIDAYSKSYLRGEVLGVLEDNSRYILTKDNQVVNCNFDENSQKWYVNPDAPSGYRDPNVNKNIIDKFDNKEIKLNDDYSDSNVDAKVMFILSENDGFINAIVDYKDDENKSAGYVSAIYDPDEEEWSITDF